MSQLQEFWQMVSSNLGLQKQICAVCDYEELINLILKLGQEQGYNFTYTEAANWIERDKGDKIYAEMERRQRLEAVKENTYDGFYDYYYYRDDYD